MMRRRSPRPDRRRLALAARLAVVVAAGALALSSCSSGTAPTVTVTETASQTSSAQPTVTVPTSSDETSESTTAPATSTSAADAARVSATPAFGSTDVGPNDPISVMAFHATLSSVTMTGDDGSVVNGEIADGKSWSNTDELKYGVTYTISGDAVDTSGATQPFDGTIATVKPESTIQAAIQIPEGQTVGIAAPIVLTFLSPVTDKAALKDRLHVTVNDGEEIQGAWVWMQDEQVQASGPKWSRLHFRPAEYWPANADVHVEADLYGVNYGSGWGRENIVRDFHIGKNMVVKADIESYRLLVVVDDQIVKNYPVSYGKESVPGRNTVAGTHIVQDKNDDNPDGSFKMCNLEYNYCNVTEYWGVRINNNGEFIHVNKQTEAQGLLGKANVSHGCVNMGMKDGKEFYDMMYYGVPVEVTGEDAPPMTERDYIWDWAKTWDQWKAISAQQSML